MITRVRRPWRRWSYQRSETTIMTTQPRSTTLNLINEALSRARMREPQVNHPEARRPARRIAMAARRREARALGNHPDIAVD